MLSPGQGVVYTLGTSTRTWQEFASLLQSIGAEVVADVRRFPTSRLEHFRREALAGGLAELGIAYLYLGKELGGYRKGGYQAFLAGEEFQQGINKLEETARERKAVILCAERFPWRCHRRFISRELEQRGWRVIHIIDEHQSWEQKAKFFGSFYT